MDLKTQSESAQDIDGTSKPSSSVNQASAGFVDSSLIEDDAEEQTSKCCVVWGGG